jgi:hypothetical protein
VIHVNAGYYGPSPRRRRACGAFAGNGRQVEPPDRRIPELRRLLTFPLWIDDAKLKGAPLRGRVVHTTNDTGENHKHEDLDEFIAFIGGDPERPED